MIPRLPDDVVEYIMKIYYSRYVVPKLNRINEIEWIWKCSEARKHICTERGAIQLGHSDYDGWLRSYVHIDEGCVVCGYDRYVCAKCRDAFRSTYVRSV
jgi:hypothetical protein